MPFRTPKDIAYDIHIKVLVGYEKGQQFHVFELSRQLPKFSMYALIEDDAKIEQIFRDPKVIDPSIDHVAFKLNERSQRICLWINQVGYSRCSHITFTHLHVQFQNFLLPTDIEPNGIEGTDELRLPLISLYDNSEVTLWFYNRNNVRIMTNNMDLAGNLIQSLTKFLNIENLTVSKFVPFHEIRVHCSQLTAHIYLF